MAFERTGASSGTPSKPDGKIDARTSVRRAELLPISSRGGTERSRSMQSASPRRIRSKAFLSPHHLLRALTPTSRSESGAPRGRGDRWSQSVLENNTGAAAFADFTAHRLGFQPCLAADARGVSKPRPEGAIALLLDQRLFLVQRRGQGPDDRLEESHCHRLLEMSCQLLAPRRPRAFRFEFQRLEAPRIDKRDAGVLERFLPVETQIDRRRRVVAPVLCRKRRNRGRNKVCSKSCAKVERTVTPRLEPA